MAAHRLIELAFDAQAPALPEPAATREPGLGGLFHTAAFFRLHASARPGPASYFEWSAGTRVAATIHFTAMGGGLWRNPARGTFAGYAWASDLRVEEALAFHDAVESRLAAQGAQRIEILLPPMAHDPTAFSNQLYLLRARGFEMSRCDLNQSLDVRPTPLAERMTYGNVKCLRKCQRAGLSAAQLPASALSEAYHTLAANRASIGVAMSMTREQLETMARTFPDAMVLFGCRDGERLAAAAVCLRLTPAVLYVFYWGDLPEYGSMSPVVPLAEAIYRYAQDHGVALLDAGTSTVDREPNFGLIQFKRGLGFNESLKVVMSKAV